VDTEFSGELALFALQYGLAKTWRKWGVEPSICIGSGVGEYAAACVAGVLSLQDAISILLLRREIILNEESLVSFLNTYIYKK
jgi:acyl transferase domain-containing protein